MPDATKHLAGKESQSAPVRNALNQLGRCPADLCTDEMLFGLGGGISLIYFMFHLHETDIVIIGTTYHASEAESPVFHMQMCEAWGATTELIHSSSRSAATKKLIKQLDEGQTPIVWVEYTKLPYMFLTGHPNMYHSIIVYERDGDDFIIGDVAESPIRISGEELEEVRVSHYAPKFRSLLIKDAPENPDLREAITERIRLTCSQMIDGLGISNFGLQAYGKMAAMITNTKNKKGWPRLYESGRSLHAMASTLYDQIELRGYGGSAFRGMYAGFLEQSAGVLKKPALKTIADQFRESEAGWKAFANAAMPSSIPILKETREALDRRAVLFRKARTEKVNQELDSLRTRLKELRQKSTEEIKLSSSEILDWFAVIRERTLEIEAIERAAFAELRKTV